MRPAQGLSLGLWIPDLFMRRIEANAVWSLFCPNEAPGLCDVYGDEFCALYERYEREGRARSTVPAQKLWFAIVDAQLETGMPYMLFKDACNGRSNQSHLGIIRGSDQCGASMGYASPDETAVWIAATVALPRFIVPGVCDDAGDGRLRFDHARLRTVVKAVVGSLNRAIDMAFYPISEARRGALRHRSIGLGVQGLADVFIALHYPFDSDAAARLNRDIFETIYYGALEASCELAEREGPCEAFAGSPASRGMLQFDLWGVQPSTRWNWPALKKRILTSGLRNASLVAQRSPGISATILGLSESTEPYASHVRFLDVGNDRLTVVNEALVADLQACGLWSDAVRDRIIELNGSIQAMDDVPSDIRHLYRTIWEIPQKSVIDLAADRGPFVDQSQSLSVHLADPSAGKLTSLHFYAWRKGLKVCARSLHARRRHRSCARSLRSPPRRAQHADGHAHATHTGRDGTGLGRRFPPDPRRDRFTAQYSPCRHRASRTAPGHAGSGWMAGASGRFVSRHRAGHRAPTALGQSCPRRDAAAAGRRTQAFTTQTG